MAPPEGHGTHGGSQHLQRVVACRLSPSLLQARCPHVPVAGCPPEEGVWGTKLEGISPTRRDGGRAAWGAGPPQQGLRAGSPAPSVLALRAHLLQRGLRAEILPSQKLTACVPACGSCPGERDGVGAGTGTVGLFGYGWPMKRTHAAW